MAEHTIWTCDGCDDELNVTAKTTHDWKVILVSIEGFTGYPVIKEANGERRFHLCAVCQKLLADRANPRHWPRAAQVAVSE